MLKGLVPVLVVLCLAQYSRAGVESNQISHLSQSLRESVVESDTHDSMWYKIGKDQQFKDVHGRSTIFRGIALCNKGGTFAYEDIPDSDVQYLAEELGFNTIRLCIYWEAIERVRGQYDLGYLASIRKTVNQFAKFGIHTILDLHQDVYAHMLCGRGAPDWAVWESPLVSKALPFPIPVEGLTKKYPRDPETNYVTDCSTSYWWGEFYLSATLGDAFHGLYKNKNGILDSFVDMWKVVANYFKDSGAVIGYELLNEPWAGQHVLNPKLLLEKVADRENLQPMYQKLHKAIREVDDRHIIFYEPSLVTTQVLPRHTGFTEGPGGPTYDDRQVFAWHHYCPINPDGKARTRVVCDFYFAETSFQRRDEDVKRLGHGTIITEYGAISTGDQKGVDEVYWVVRLANKYLQSWIYWAFNKGNRYDSPFVHTVVNPYPKAVAGTITSMEFQNATGTFHMTYDVDTNVDTTESLVHTAANVWYRDGMEVSVTPAEAVQFEVKDATLVIRHTDKAVSGTTIAVDIKKKKESGLLESGSAPQAMV